MTKPPPSNKSLQLQYNVAFAVTETEVLLAKLSQNERLSFGNDTKERIKDERIKI